VHRAEHRLSIVGRRSIAGQCVIADQIRCPLHRAVRPGQLADVDKQRRVAGHHDNVGVALDTGHPCRISKRASHVRCRRSNAGGPLAREDLGLVGARIAVVVESVILHVFERAVVMLIDEVRHAAVDALRFGMLITDG